MQLVKYWALAASSIPYNNYPPYSTPTKSLPPSSSHKSTISSSVKPSSSHYTKPTTTHPTSSVWPTSSKPTTSMPSLTSIVTSTLLTITTLVPTTSCAPPHDIFGPIEGLSQCAQTIIFNSLADSSCNPADFACNCAELDRRGVVDKIRRDCTEPQLAQYNAFVASICRNNRQPSISLSSINITSTPAPVTTPIPVPIITGVPTPNTTNITSVGPFINVTTATATEIVIPTTDVNGEPTTLTQAVGPTAPTEPSEPDFTGAAAVVQFGYTRAGLMAGGIGIMGLVFAEL